VAEIRRGRQSENGPVARAPAGSVHRLGDLDWLHDATASGIWEGVEFPAGQTAAERIKAILDWAGFGTSEPPASVETCGFRIVDVDGAPVFICNQAPHPEAPHVHGMYDGHTGTLNRGTEVDRG